MKIKLKDVRLAFPQLFEAKSVNGGAEAFSASFIMGPNHPSIAEVNAAIEQVAKDKWGAKSADILKGLRAQDRVCLHNGDTKTQYEGFEGNFFVSTSSKIRPLVADKDGSALSPSDGKPYSGCYVYATIELWAQDNSFGKRVNAEVKTVQFFRDGDAFTGGSRPADPDDIEDLTAGADAGALA
ncbi:hypothetical protein BSL82_10020 [Tardibacter chloracetimidivorans]|uniref:DUF2815 domain-containing protein n=1 Tax=Tardibacter chloracetimidivorans TaxID=1921510 RepID=A0A1L3ZVK4_9SPHN|nr:DUF2815 family protein [Tardibacter chloracetimidivorans]API59609.1 hypothetical protein BSL82_10020 [Tardibacter chloracetimidivorans]